MLLPIWRLLRSHLRRPAWSLASVTLIAIVAGVLEATVLVIVVTVTMAVADGSADMPIEIPGFGTAATATSLIWFAAAVAIALFGIHAVNARVSSSLSTEVLESARARAVTSYLRASWPAQAVNREGALQDSVSSLAVVSANLCVSFSSAIAALLNLLALVLAALVVDPFATIVVIAVGLALFLAVRPMAGLTQRLSTRFARDNSAFAQDVSRAASLVMEFRLFGVLDRIERDLIDQSHAVAIEHRRSRFASIFGSSLYKDLAGLCLVGGIAVLLSTEGARLAAVSSVLLLMVRALGYATSFQGNTQSISEYSPHATALELRLRDLDAAAELGGDDRIEDLGRVEFIDVGYDYEREIPAIRNIDLVIERGEAVGIVGPSGSGKSTLIQVLLRLRRPSRGEVRVAGRPYVEIDSQTWASMVALVPQEPRLMEATIEENVRFFRPGISRSEVEQAADAAHVGDEIRRLPNGFDTLLGPRGAGLSGGQKQRIAIARALVGTPQMLVLDEPTSALDSASEQLLATTIDELKGRVTLVIIAHRMSTLDRCDRLVTMRDGAIQEAAVS